MVKRTLICCKFTTSLIKLIIIDIIMKKVFVLAVAASAFIVSCQRAASDQSTTSAPQEVAAEKGATYTVNKEASNVKWTGYHKGGLNPRFGIMKSAGTLSAENGVITGGSFVIDMNSVLTDAASVDPASSGGKTSADLDLHLKNADFFDVAKYPTAKFEITSVKSFDAATDKSTIADANFVISGNLTIKEKTVNVTFPAKAMVSDTEIALTSKFTINRQDWGLVYGTDGDAKDWMISQEIDIELNIKGNK